MVTARAGTPLIELEAALAERRQMLAFEPFDHAPLFGHRRDAQLSAVSSPATCRARAPVDRRST